MDHRSPSHIESVVNGYPASVQLRFEEFSQLITEVASNIEDLKRLDEEIKWGEPSYKSNIGSPVRFGWSSKRPDQFGIYFVCSTSLVETFQKVFPGVFTLDGNRGLIFDINLPLSREPLERCLEAALRYKKLKDLPFLGL